MTTQSQVLMTPGGKPSEDIVGKGENAAMFSALFRPNFKFSATFILSAASAFNLDQSKIFLFIEELTLSQTSPGFYVSRYKSFENTLGKGEIAH